MASDKFTTLLIGLVLFVGFTWVLLTVAIDFGAEYGKSTSEIGDGSLNLVQFQQRQRVLKVMHKVIDQDLKVEKLMM